MGFTQVPLQGSDLVGVIRRRLACSLDRVLDHRPSRDSDQVRDT